MNSKYRGIIFIILMATFEIISQYFLQKATKVPGSWFRNKNLWYGIIGQMIMGALYFLVLKSGYSLAVANTMVDGGGAIGIILLGYYIFNQHISTKQFIAIGITMVGVLAISFLE